MASAAAKPIIDGVAKKAPKIPGRDEHDVKCGWQWRWKRGIMQRIILCKPNKNYVNITNSSDEWKRIDIAAKAAKQSRQSQQDGIP